MTKRDFPDAPAGSYVCEEGWLVIRDEAWTVREWAGEHGKAYRDRHRGQSVPARGTPKYSTEAERREAIRRTAREYQRRRREARRAA